MSIDNLARICWNDNGWLFPAGVLRHAEQSVTWAGKNGFGHEEWLFNYTWIIDGYRHTFLQQLTKRAVVERLSQKDFDLVLFTIDETGRRWRVASLQDCRIVDHDEAKRIVQIYKKKGWAEEMLQHVKDVSGDTHELRKCMRSDPTFVFNVSFKPGCATLYDPLEELAIEKRWARYGVLYSLESDGHGRTYSKPGKPTRKARKADAKTSRHTRRSIDATIVDPIHAKLQNKLVEDLKRDRRVKNVACELDYVDIRFQIGDRVVFIEIKSNPIAKRAIREAIGQLLEYSFYERSGTEYENLTMVIVAPGKASSADERFLKRLRSIGLPVFYRRFNGIDESINLSDLS